MEHYVLKYDKQDNLYCYIERNRSGKILSYFHLTNKRLIRYDSNSKYKYLIEYKETCNLAQRFQETESWVTVIKNTDSLYSGDFPAKKREICVKGSNVVSFTLSKEFVNTCKYVSSSTHKNDSFVSFRQGNVIISPIY